MVSGYNFWLVCPTKVRSTQLSYIFKALFRDTPLAYNFFVPPATCRLATWPPGHLAGYTRFMAFWGRFGAFWSPPMAISDPKNGSYTSARMFPAEIQPWSTQYNQFGDTRGASGRIYLIYSILRPFLAIKIVQKTTKKIGSSWISIYLNHRDPLKPLVHLINTLFLDPPP